MKKMKDNTTKRRLRSCIHPSQCFLHLMMKSINTFAMSELQANLSATSSSKLKLWKSHQGCLIHFKQICGSNVGSGGAK